MLQTACFIYKHRVCKLPIEGQPRILFLKKLGGKRFLGKINQLQCILDGWLVMVLFCQPMASYKSRFAVVK